jgi:hypothetical protein
MSYLCKPFIILLNIIVNYYVWCVFHLVGMVVTEGCNLAQVVLTLTPPSTITEAWYCARVLSRCRKEYADENIPFSSLNYRVGVRMNPWETSNGSIVLFSDVTFVWSIGTGQPWSSVRENCPSATMLSSHLTISERSSWVLQLTGVPSCLLPKGFNKNQLFCRNLFNLTVISPTMT